MTDTQGQDPLGVRISENLYGLEKRTACAQSIFNALFIFFFLSLYSMILTREGHVITCLLLSFNLFFEFVTFIRS